MKTATPAKKSKLTVKKLEKKVPLTITHLT